MTMPEQRVAEARKLGFKTCIIPEVSLKALQGVSGKPGINIMGVKSVNQVISML